MSVIGGNSLANVASFTPGAVGITQAVNAASLENVTDATTATAYSLGQQLIVTAWNQVFAIVLLVWAFGWTGGKQLVRDSYGEAKGKVAEQIGGTQGAQGGEAGGTGRRRVAVHPGEGLRSGRNRHPNRPSIVVRRHQAARGARAVGAQQDTVQRQVLPIPDRPYAGLVTYDAKDPATSFPPIEPLRPPSGAPNVLDRS